MDKIKVIMIGVGHDHAQPVYDTVIHLDMFDVVGFAVPESEKRDFPDKIEKYKKYIPYYEPEELFRLPAVDAAIIETEEVNLTKYSIMALRNGLSVHSDKPGGLELSEFQSMIELAKKDQKVLHFGYMYRYNPLVIKLLEDIKNGECGEIFSVEAQMNCLHPDEKRAWLRQFPGGMLFFLGCHLIDLILTIQGEPEEIIPLSTASHVRGIDSEDIGMVVFRYKNGVSFAKSCAAEIGGFMRRQLVVCGSKKTVEINPLEVIAENNLQYATVRETTYEEAQELTWDRSAEKRDSEKFHRYADMMKSFAQMVMGEKENPYSYDYELTLYKTLLKSCGMEIKG